jgi:hypothetical protein
MNYWRNPPAHLREREAARFSGLAESNCADLAQTRIAECQS